MPQTSCTRGNSLDRAFCIALLAVAATIVSVVAGYYLAVILTDFGAGGVAARELNPYIGCQLPVEYLSRVAQQCRSVLLQSFLLWVAPYTKFDGLLSACVFIERGISLGLALRFCAAGSAGLSVTLLPLLYTVVTAILILFSYSLRDSHTVRPVGDTFVHFLIASGFAFIIYTVTPWIL